MSALNPLRKHLRPGQVYRRKELARWSKAVDRHLAQLVEEGRLEKVSGGLYMVPRETRFGKAAAADEELVGAFLGDDRYLLVSPNAYNGLGVGTTQLYNAPVVYNRKRHGRLDLDGRPYEFRRRMSFPKTVSAEFLLVDLLHNLDRLAEDTDAVRERALARAAEMDATRLSKAVHDYDSARVRRLLAPVLEDDNAGLAA
ncbi:hypothetical protein [Vitreimonas flagellata]|uniref:hypothetical protein n=1 Tax=Vitreimonas flagellata TaxID=2560861 RepID=UPI0010757744|nr:hypothetical protein [Vitreimonas flagellata]